MTEDEDRQEQAEQAIDQLVDAYSKLVAMATAALGKQHRHVTETVDGMKEREAKAMLNMRVTLGAIEFAKKAKHNQAEAAKYFNNGGSPTLN